VVGGSRVDEAVRLLAVDRLVQMAVKKGVLHVQLMYLPGARSGDAEDDADGSRFNNRTECLVVVDVVLLRKTTNDPPGFMRAREPSARYLCLKTHLPVMTLARGGRGTRRHVPLSMSALYSSAIAACQFRSASAARELTGSRGRDRCRRREAIALDGRRQGARLGASLTRRRSWCR